MIYRNNKASLERKQQKLEAGLVSKYFPEVARIVVGIIYKQKGLAKPILRTLNFYPGSCAYFEVSCLSDDCVDGGFDLTQLLTSMVRNRSEEAKGELGCNDSGPRANHSHIAYEVDIQYA